MKYAVGIDLEKIEDYMAGYALDRFLLIEADNKEEAVENYLQDENIAGWIREDEKKLVKAYDIIDNSSEERPSYQFNIFINNMRKKYGDG